MNTLPTNHLPGISINPPETRSPIEINTLSEVGATAWDSFVGNTEGSLPTQISAWKDILHQSYGLSLHFLAAQQDGHLLGVLPLYRVKSPFTGDSLQSMSGGVCATTHLAAQALISAADSLARELDVDYLLLRDSRQAWDNCCLEILEAHRGVRLHLPAESETAWNNLHKDLRYHIRSGTRRGNLEITVGQSYVDEFYEVLLRGNHDKGTPLFSKKFLQNVTRSFTNGYNIAISFFEGEPTAGYFNLIHCNCIVGMWGATLRNHISLMPTHRLYWSLFEQAISQGVTMVDMGRTAYPSSQYEFKAKWGDEIYPIYQLFTIYHGKTPPTLNINKAINDHGGVSTFRRVWSRLPLFMARTLGPIVRRQVPFG
ncbi:MAG: hypothetical protein A2Y53_02040 [Chloroflexi bacterium RBG_16_47_49]|nr:MAG: hypothetical protein A2Y53_02040 [Chloroflexi bacterium RBG_16_47_49]